VEFSVLLLTHNEEKNVLPCLSRLARAKRIVAVDSGSTDRTLDILREQPAVEILERPFSNFAEQRNFGLSAFNPGDWVLHLDADERLTRRLAREIETLPAEGPSAYNIAPLNVWRGRPIPRATFYPTYQTRLTRVGDFQFVQVGHGQKAPSEAGPIPRLSSPYIHLPFSKGMAEWLARHHRYAQSEAKAFLRDRRRRSPGSALLDPIARRQWIRRATRFLPGRPALVFWYLMLMRGAIGEGAPGRDYCRLRAYYEKLIQRELRRLRLEKRL